MILLNCGAVLVQWRPISRLKVDCVASPSVPAEQLRQQLDSLHKEADITRQKDSIQGIITFHMMEIGARMNEEPLSPANNARLRLMRLSEAVGNLRRQAAVCVQTGKESDARELLYQKKKVMQAMEKLKTRIELYDQLSKKLLEAISMKESLLVENMASDVDVNEAESPNPIRIVSPLEESPNSTDDNQYLDLNNLEFEEDHESQDLANSQGEIHAFNDHNNPDGAISGELLASLDQFQGPTEAFTFKDFMTHIDQQLNKIEEELESFMRFSNLLLEHRKKPEYLKVQHAAEILEGVCRVRERIAIIKQIK